MKISGKPILGSGLRFTFEVAGNDVSTADAMAIKKLDAAVCNSPTDGNTTTLADVVHILNQIDTYEVKIRVESVENDDT